MRIDRNIIFLLFGLRLLFILKKQFRIILLRPFPKGNVQQLKQNRFTMNCPSWTKEVEIEWVAHNHHHTAASFSSSSSSAHSPLLCMIDWAAAKAKGGGRQGRGGEGRKRRKWAGKTSKCSSRRHRSGGCEQNCRIVIDRSGFFHDRLSANCLALLKIGQYIGNYRLSADQADNRPGR